MTRISRADRPIDLDESTVHEDMTEASDGVAQLETLLRQGRWSGSKESRGGRRDARRPAAAHSGEPGERNSMGGSRDWRGEM